MYIIFKPEIYRTYQGSVYFAYYRGSMRKTKYLFNTNRLWKN